MLSRNHKHFTELIKQIFIDFHPKLDVQCVGGDVPRQELSY
jgi:hypothetical protein